MKTYKVIQQFYLEVKYFWTCGDGCCSDWEFGNLYYSPDTFCYMFLIESEYDDGKFDVVDERLVNDSRYPHVYKQDIKYLLDEGFITEEI